MKSVLTPLAAREGGYLPMILGTLASSLLGSELECGAIKTSEGVIRAG